MGMHRIIIRCILLRGIDSRKNKHELIYQSREPLKPLSNQQLFLSSPIKGSHEKKIRALEHSCCLLSIWMLHSSVLSHTIALFRLQSSCLFCKSVRAPIFNSLGRRSRTWQHLHQFLTTNNIANHFTEVL